MIDVSVFGRRCTALANCFCVQPRSCSRWSRPCDLAEDSLLVCDRSRLVDRVVALKMPTVVDATEPLDDQPLLGVHAEHQPVERVGPTRIKHHEVAVADGRYHGVTDDPGAYQPLRARPRRQSRSGNRHEHFRRLLPHGSPRPGRQPHIRGERDRHAPDFRLSEPTCLDSTRTVTHDRTVWRRSPHFRRDRIAAGGSDRAHQPLRMALQVRRRTQAPGFAVVGVDTPEALHRPV